MEDENLSLTQRYCRFQIPGAIAAPKELIDSPVKVVFDKRITLGYILSQTRRFSAPWPRPPARLGVTVLGMLKLSYIRLLSKPLGFKR